MKYWIDQKCIDPAAVLVMHRQVDVVCITKALSKQVDKLSSLIFVYPQSQYRHHKEVEAAQGVKIVGKDLDKVLAGLPMYVAKYQDEVEVYKVRWFTYMLTYILTPCADRLN